MIAAEDGPQVLVGRFMYGPLDMVALTGEKVPRAGPPLLSQSTCTRCLVEPHGMWGEGIRRAELPGVEAQGQESLTCLGGPGRASKEERMGSEYPRMNEEPGWQEPGNVRQGPQPRFPLPSPSAKPVAPQPSGNPLTPFTATGGHPGNGRAVLRPLGTPGHRDHQQ